jgi:hypothetical protein
VSGKVGEDGEKMAEGSKTSGDGEGAPGSEAEAISRRGMERTGEMKLAVDVWQTEGC